MPAVPPEFNGLGDYARQLWRHWPEPRPEWHVAALRVPAGAAEAWPGVAFHPFQPTAQSLLEALLESRAEAVALHYVGHGYHPKGVPLWLPKALAGWKSATGGRLVTFFHELWVEGGRWPAWLLWRAGGRLVAKVLGGTSLACITSCELYQRMLRDVAVQAQQLPVGPNILPSAPCTWQDKISLPTEVAVFGLPATRSSTLEAFRDTLVLAASRGLVSRLVLIGASPASQSENRIADLLRQAGAIVERQHDLPEPQISEVLRACNVGLANTRPEILGKSGTTAALIHHGCCVLAPASVDHSSPLLPREWLVGSLPPASGSKLRHRQEYARLTEWSRLAALFHRCLAGTDSNPATTEAPDEP